MIKFNLKALNEIKKNLFGLLDDETLTKIGETIKQEMLNDISKGISPIKGFGRFPAYKWAGFANEIRKHARSIKDKEKRKQFREEALNIEKNRYPFTSYAKSLGKKPRPVNLKLTGDFIKSLVVWISGSGRKKTVNVGFKDKLSLAKEKGHREGANGQPQRPIIPQGRETLSPKYALKIKQVLLQNIKLKSR